MAAPGWIQDHVIIGGWPNNMDPDARIAPTQAASTAAGRDTADVSLHPFAPKNSTIVKVPFSMETTACQGHFHLQRNNSNLWRPQHPGPRLSLWASLERPPEVAYRRRILGQAADSVRAMLPMDAAAAVRTDMSAGTITYSRLAALEMTPAGWLEQTGRWHTCEALRDKSRARVNTKRND